MPPYKKKVNSKRCFHFAKNISQNACKFNFNMYLCKAIKEQKINRTENNNKKI